MLKKLTITTALFVLTACGNNVVNHTPEPPFKISDEEMKEFVLKINNFEQCVRPELKGMSYEEAEKRVYSKHSETEKIVWSIYWQTILRQIIGVYNLNSVNNNPIAHQYFQEKHHKFNNQIANIDKKECAQLRKEYKRVFADTQKELKAQKAKALATQRQQEKEAKARQAFYATPQGQAYLAQQKMIAQQQQIIAQQRAIVEQQQQSSGCTDAFGLPCGFGQGVQNSNQMMMDNLNQMNQMNKMNQMNQINQSLKALITAYNK